MSHKGKTVESEGQAVVIGLAAGQWHGEPIQLHLFDYREIPREGRLSVQAGTILKPSDGVEPFIDIKTLERKLGVCERTIERLMKDGLPSHKLRRSRRFLYSEVSEWVRVNCPDIRAAS